jgi:hypothetical protein
MLHKRTESFRLKLYSQVSLSRAQLLGTEFVFVSCLLIDNAHASVQANILPKPQDNNWCFFKLFFCGH